MPATTGDYYGVKNADAIDGLVTIGWSLGRVVGPLIAATLIAEDKNYSMSQTTLKIVALVVVALPFITKPPRLR